MRKFLLLIRIGSSSSIKASDILPKILPILDTDIAKPLDLGDHCAVLFESSKEAVELARSISDHIYESNSFVILELGKDWAACNIQTKPDSWMRNHLNGHEFVGQSRSLHRG